VRPPSDCSTERIGIFPTLQRIHDACEEIAHSELGLSIYPNQIEVITAEQMLDTDGENDS
jgi:spore cortex formation protein SpoVR/YcgB (stage V sporulation)